MVGHWNTKELIATVNLGLAEIAARPLVTVYSIVDVSESLQLPHNIEQAVIQIGINASKALPKNTGLTVIAGGGMLVDIVLEAFYKRHPSKKEWFRTVANVEEARSLLADLASF
jgi:hypothetical protein